MSTNTGGAGGKADSQPKQAKKKPASKKKINGKVGVKGSVTPPEVQAQIIAAVLSGQFTSEAEIAKAVGVSKHTVNRTKKHIPDEYLSQIEPAKKERVGELVVEFLESTLESLKAINTHTSEQEWVNRQDASGLAVLFGVKADKIAKILEAIERANEPAPDTISGTEGAPA